MKVGSAVATQNKPVDVTLSINTREVVFPSTEYVEREHVCDMTIKSMPIGTAAVQIEFNAVL